MEDQPVILVIDDDEQLTQILVQVLTQEGYRVQVALTGNEGIASARLTPPRLILLDLMLPDLYGREVCREVRKWLDVPIIILSARDSEQEKVLALDEGADDYLTKPFSIVELSARVRAHLRRVRPQPTPPQMLNVGDLIVDQTRRQVTRDGQVIALTATEYAILCYLILHADRVVTIRALQQAVQDTSQGDLASLRVHISHLRKKVVLDTDTPPYLKTEHGIGFRLVTFGIGDIPEVAASVS